METSVTISKGHLTIPARIRKKYGIKAGTRIHFIEEKDGIKIIPVTAETINNNIGLFKKDGASLLKVLAESKAEEKKLEERKEKLLMDLFKKRVKSKHH